MVFSSSRIIFKSSLSNTTHVRTKIRKQGQSLVFLYSECVVKWAWLAPYPILYTDVGD